MIITYSIILAMLKDLLDSFKITPNQIKIFVATFIAVSIMVGLQRMGVHSPIHSPIAFLSLDK